MAPKLSEKDGQKYFTPPQVLIRKPTILGKKGLASSSRLKNQRQPNFGALLNGLGVDLRGEGEERLGPPLVLDEGASQAMVVVACLHSSGGVQGMLRPKGDGVLFA
jgi:hypothetical protein